MGPDPNMGPLQAPASLLVQDNTGQTGQAGQAGQAGLAGQACNHTSERTLEAGSWQGGAVWRTRTLMKVRTNLWNPLVGELPERDKRSTQVHTHTHTHTPVGGEHNSYTADSI